MDEQMISETSIALNRVKLLLNSRILWNDFSVYRNSVLIEILININDLLIKADKLDNRVIFNDDIILNDNFKIKDITDLIKNFRDASCHNHSFRKKFSLHSTSFCEIGPGCILGYIGDIKLENKYNDDFAFVMGKNTLYLKRHIERAFTEVEIIFKTYNIY